MSASPLEAFVANVSSPDRGGWIQLPISRADFLEAVSAIGVTDPGKDSILVTMAEPELEVLAPHLKEPFDLDELNLLASKLEQADMSDEQYNIFAACLQAGRHCDGAAALINLLDNLDRFDLHPAMSPEQYGAFHVNLAQDTYAKPMEELENAENPFKNDFAGYISDLERCLDIKAYGRLMAERENGVFTDFGYLVESANFQEVYRGTQDIPAEFRVSPFREAQPLLKLEHTDLTGALTRIHGQNSRYAPDLDRNLSALHRRRSADFLLLLTGDKAVLSESMHVYREGTSAHNAFVNAGEAKMFSIYVTDFQTGFIGDIHEVDASARRADILDNSIRPVAVEVETGDGERLSLTPEEWKNVSLKERDSFQGWTRRFADGAYPRLFQHIGRQSELDGERGKAVSAEQFFAKLEQGLPAKSVERVPGTRPESVLARIAAARAGHAPDTPKPEAPEHRAGPER